MAQLDPSIILRASAVQPLQAADVLEKRQQIQLRNIEQQRQQRQDQMAEQQLAMATQKQQTLASVGRQAAAGDMAGARTTALGAGDFDLVTKLQSMDDAGRERAFKISQATAPLLLSLKTVQPTQRAQALQQLAPELQARGFTPDHIAQLAQQGLSDQALDQIGASAQTIAEYNKKLNDDRTFGLEKDKFGHTVEHDNATEALTANGQRVTMRGQDLSHADAAAGRGVTIRGQNMTDQRAKDEIALKASGAGLRPVPASTTKAYIDNNTSMRKIDRAVDLLSKHEAAVGGKNYVPDALMQRMDPNGVATRAAIADIGSLLIHDRSGAAVTASETPRLKPFIPSTTDTPETVRSKLKNLRAALEETNSDMDSVYSPQQGYKGMPQYGGAGSEHPADIQALLKKYAR